MQAQDWRDLLQVIPSKYQDILVLYTTGGAELAVQEIVRSEGPYLVLRGRVSGTTDTDRAFFVPYDSIAFVRFQRPVPDVVLYGFYGLTPPESTAKSAPAEEPSAATEQPAAAEAEAAPPPAEPAPEPSPLPVGATPPRGVNRTKLLERIRQRYTKERDERVAAAEDDD